MSKLVNLLLLGIVGLTVLGAAGPAIGRLVSALVPLVLVAGVVVAVLKLIDYYTRQ